MKNVFMFIYVHNNFVILLKQMFQENKPYKSHFDGHLCLNK